MRGKLENTKALIELISIEIERIDTEFKELWVSFEYTCPGGEYKSAMSIPIGNSMEMTNHFFRELITEAHQLSKMEDNRNVSFYLTVSNKASTMLQIKNVYQHVIEVIGSGGILEENASYIDLCTSGVNFRSPSSSLSNKNFDERFKFFMSRAKDKMSHGFYTLAADDLEKAKILCSSSSIIYKLTGICHRELGNLDLALEALLKSIELGDNDKDTYLYISEIYFFLGEMDSASEVLNDLIEIYPADCRILVEYANIAYQQGKEFISIIDNAFHINPDETRDAIIQTFVFKKVIKKDFNRISIDKASDLLGIKSETILMLASRNKIPVRHDTSFDDPILDEEEIKAWAAVYTKYRLINDEIEGIPDTLGESGSKGLDILS